MSGGCIEDDLIDKVRAGALAATSPQITRYGVGAEEAHEFGLPCGGTLELVLEPIGEASRIDELLEALSHGELVAPRVSIWRPAPSRSRRRAPPTSCTSTSTSWSPRTARAGGC